MNNRINTITEYLNPILTNETIKSNIDKLVEMNFDNQEFMELYNATHQLMEKIQHRKRYEGMNTLRNILYIIIIFLKAYKNKYPKKEISPLQAYFLYYVAYYPHYTDILLDPYSVLYNIESKIIITETEIDTIMINDIQLSLDIQGQMLSEETVGTAAAAATGVGGKSRKRKSRRMRTRKMKERKSKKRKTTRKR